MNSEKNKIVCPLVEGLKFDKNKAKLHMIPLVALEEEAKAWMIGEKKYDKWNFTNGMDYSRALDAALRHIYQYLEGESHNVETFTRDGKEHTMKCHHLGSARACLAMVLEWERTGKGNDDRKPK